MRKTDNALLAFGLIAIFAGNVFAGSLMNEAFSYSDGGLVTTSGANWTNHSGTGTDLQVLSGVVNGNMASAPDDNRLLSSARTATDKTYACFNLTVPQQPAAGIVANYFAHFMVNSTTFRSKVFITPTAGSFTVGLSVTANASGTPLAVPAAPLGATWPSDLTFGQTYRITISYDAVGGVSELWVNGGTESDPKITATDASATGGALTAFGLRESNTGGCAYLYTVDNISVGTTFIDACPGPVAAEKALWGTVKSLYR